MDTERTIQFILETQAKHETTIQTILETQAKHETTIQTILDTQAKHETTIQTILEAQAKHEERFTTLVDVCMSLARHGEETDRRFRETDEKLNTLIDIVDKLVKRNGSR